MSFYSVRHTGELSIIMKIIDIDTQDFDIVAYHEYERKPDSIPVHYTHPLYLLRPRVDPDPQFEAPSRNLSISILTMIMITGYWYILQDDGLLGDTFMKPEHETKNLMSTIKAGQHIDPRY
ncbi:hypothetical protein DFH27DRAFT_526070 [Peziza echinospora]|nr:hypothetical protein DFH27DRAFT_526070 [Peziza echinospora]